MLIDKDIPALGPHYMPHEMLTRIVTALMHGTREDLILANEVNRLFGASARRSWDRDHGETR